MKINIIKYIDIVFFLYAIIACLSERTILGDISLILMCSAAFFIVIMKKRIFFSWFLFLEFAFLLFCFIQIILGIPIFKDEAASRLLTLCICFIFNLVAYNCLMYRKNCERIGILIAKGFAIALVITILINFQKLLIGIRGIETAGIKIAGISIGVIDSVTIAWTAGCGIILTSAFLSTKKTLSYYIYVFIFSFAIVLSGTRKALIFILIAYLIDRISNENIKNILLKLFKNIFFTGIIGIIMLFLILKVPFLYDLIGQRIEGILIYMTTGTGADASFDTRMRLVELAKDAFLQKPYLGWGLDNFKYLFYGGKYYTHNNFLEIAVSGGIVGFIIYYSKYVYLLVQLIKKWKHSVGRESMITLSFIIGLITLVILEYWQVTYFSRKTLLIYIFLIAFTMLKSCDERQMSNNIFDNLQNKEE